MSFRVKSSEGTPRRGRVLLAAAMMVTVSGLLTSVSGHDEEGDESQLMGLHADLFGGHGAHYEGQFLFQGDLLAGPEAAMVGAWTDPVEWPFKAIHQVLLPTGKILAWEIRSFIYLIDPATGATERVAPPTLEGSDEEINIFCVGHVVMPDGRAFLVGGTHTEGSRGASGAPYTWFFDPWTETWEQGPAMERGRWYPAVLTLADGSVITFSGTDFDVNINEMFEILRPGAAEWEHIPSADIVSQLYPWVHLMPDGDVVRAGPDARIMFLDTETWTWSDGPFTKGSYRDGGTSVLLPSLDKILIIGGGARAELWAYNTELLDLSGDEPSFEPVAQMATARRDVTAVYMPDGKIFVSGGAVLPRRVGGFDIPIYTPESDKYPATLVAEVFDPETMSWLPAASHQRGRTYHSTSVLLPDGRVLVAGSDIETTKETDLNQHTSEVYYPPYMFAASRPEILAAPEVVIHDELFTVASPDAGDIARVTMIRMGTSTHSMFYDQRFLELDFELQGDDLIVSSPSGPTIAPPGWYHIFVLDENGTPSVGKQIRIL